MTTFTVTATQGGNKANGMALVLKVVTGAAAGNQYGVTGNTQTATPSLQVTPVASGSWVYGAALVNSVSLTALSGTTFEQNASNAGLGFISMRSTAVTTAATPVTIGASGTLHGLSLALAELAASATLAEDASSPAAVPGASVETQTTASFTPPAGSLLVLMVATNGATGTTTMAVTDTSGLGLNWVQQSVSNGNSKGYAGVWTAQMPGGTGPAASPLNAPVRSRTRGPARGGYYCASRAPAAAPPAPTTGPAFTPLSQPAGVRTLVARTGHVQSGPGTIAPYVASQAYPPQGPVRARQPLPRRGRVHGITRALPPVPVVIPVAARLPAPARARIPAARRGGAVLSTPPPLPPLVQCGAAPLYAYPTLPPWAVFLASPGPLPPVVILNSGSGAVTWNSDYETLAVSLHALGIKLLGYVPTGYGSTPAGTVEGYVANYLPGGVTPGGNGVDGIFLDEFQSASGDLSYYSGICASIGTQFAAAGSNSPLIWGNPGTTVDSSYLALPVATFVTFEGNVASYSGAVPYNVSISGTPQSGAGMWPRQRFAHLVYEVTRDQADGVIDRAAANYAGWAYATNGPGDTNPYGSIPGNDYLADEVTRAAAEPVSPTAGIPPWVYPLQGPVTARRPGPYVNGRAMAMAALTVFVTEPGPQVYPLTGPVAAKLPPFPFRKGRAERRPGIPSAYGPPLLQRAQPWGIQVYRVRTGLAQSLPGMLSGQGPAVTPLTGPVQARQPLPPRGRTHHRTGTFSQAGPPVTPLQGPVRPKLQPYPYLHGRAAAMVALEITVPVISQAVTFPLHAPVKAQPARARPQGRAITTPPYAAPVTHLAVIPQRGTPYRAPFPGPFRKGRIEHRAGTFAGQGPAPVPARQSGPQAARLPAPWIHGHAMAMVALTVTITNLAGPPVYPLHGPVRAKLPPPRQRGHAHARGGAAEGLGPSFAPLSGPVRARIPARIPGGKAHHRAGTYSGTGPEVTPLTAPVTARRPLPPQGRVIRRAGAYNGTGPQVTPLTQPVTARRPQPARYGRGTGSPGTFGGQGPVLRPPSGPVSDRRPQNAPRGRTTGNPGGPVVPPPPLQPPPGTLYLTPATITQAPPYAAITVTGTGSLLTIAPDQDARVTIRPVTEGIRPVRIDPPPDADIPSPDDVTLFPDLPG